MERIADVAAGSGRDLVALAVAGGGRDHTFGLERQGDGVTLGQQPVGGRAPPGCGPVQQHNDLLKRMARLAKKFGFEFSKTPDVNGANHDKWYVGGEVVIVPRHNEINELTARSILRSWEEMLDEAMRPQEEEGE
ncbi:hypothetical protein ACFLIM_21630 [Nonomuraea sp. M3C6]|uniref:Uncharacterized protein n=1 Tax=Nonomuraea marmarensis TaxID=3351344 RepID=A0ABW7AEN9_9ACTN